MSDQLLPIPEVPDGLREAAQRGILIPFIGAGVSRIAGCPGWVEFADGALQWLINNGKFNYSQLDQLRDLHPRVKLSLARSLETENGNIDFRKILHPQEPKEHDKGVRLYRSLFKLGKTFVTTNYDIWLDEQIPQPPAAAVAPHSGVVDTLSINQMKVVYKVEELLPSLLSEPNTVVHLHGSLRDPNGMILTTQDYVRHYANDRLSDDPKQENRVLTFLEYLFANKTVLFIGYGLEELEILEYVILKARRLPGASKQARHYILQGFFSHEEVLRRSWQSYYLNECGIQLISFLRDNKNWHQLLEVIEEFARLAPASAPLVLQKAQEMEGLLNG